MSLLINGMDMPKNCAECPILEYGSLEHYCPLAKESMWNIDTESGKHKNCPLSEISTPHGRLIDADALLSRLNETAYTANVEDWIARKPTFADASEEIISAPTVIEAEG